MKKRERVKGRRGLSRAKRFYLLFCCSSSFSSSSKHYTPTPTPTPKSKQTLDSMFGKKKRDMEPTATTTATTTNQDIPVSESASFDGSLASSGGEEEMSKSALSNFKAKEEEIERRKMEVRERVQAQLSRVEEETKRLAFIRGELEALADPMRKEVVTVGKRIDTINKELKPLGQIVQKKEKEYRDVLGLFNDKSKEKSQLLSKLVELVGESEVARMKKLEELSKSVDFLNN